MLAIATVAALAVSAATARAQAGKVAEIAGYDGRDREQRLGEGGKREGRSRLFHALTDDNAALIGAFTK